MLADPKITGLDKRYGERLASLHKSKCLMAMDRFVPVFGLKSSLLNVHELTGADRYDLDSIPMPLDLG